MRLRFSTFLLAWAAVLSAAPRDSLDPVFEKIPIEHWLREPDAGHFRWTLNVSHPELSFHQRLLSRIETKLDGRDLQDRRSHGTLLLLLQISDRSGTRYQTHGTIELSQLDENIKAADLQSTQGTFVLPGDYRLTAAILDTANGEHSIKQGQFRIAGVSRDMPPDAWSDLPPIEFIRSNESPESWFLPEIKSRVQWASSVHSAARLSVVLNIAPSESALGSRHRHGGELGALLPTLKVLSETGSANISEHVELLDLSRRRSVFHQSDGQPLDWGLLKPSLGLANTASIDVHSLSGRQQDAQFFVSQVRRILRASDTPCVLVVLTTPVAFDSGEDLQPISLEALPASRVVYIRYRPPIERLRPYDPRMSGRRGRMGGGGMRIPLPDLDQLESTLKPLKPKVFDVESPEQMTKALAETARALEALSTSSSR